MEKHTIEFESLYSWQQEHSVLFAESQTEKKAFYCTLRGSYEVWHNGERVLETMQPFRAVEKYNSI